jgi:hypothetical protein
MTDGEQTDETAFASINPLREAREALHGLEKRMRLSKASMTDSSAASNIPRL